MTFLTGCSSLCAVLLTAEEQTFPPAPCAPHCSIVPCCTLVSGAEYLQHFFAMFASSAAWPGLGTWQHTMLQTCEASSPCRRLCPVSPGYPRTRAGIAVVCSILKVSHSVSPASGRRSTPGAVSLDCFMDCCVALTAQEPTQRCRLFFMQWKLQICVILH